jgi:hypothetical protein
MTYNLQREYNLQMLRSRSKEMCAIFQKKRKLMPETYQDNPHHINNKGVTKNLSFYTPVSPVLILSYLLNK